jgi:uncharacterized protein (TIGR02646 family)
MRSYTKTVPPAELLPWQGSGRAWDDFARDAASYQPVKAVLQAEQQHLCCYCEIDLAATDSHIEHFQPRYGPYGAPTQAFDYANLGCSCNGGTERNRHCGHHKGHEYDHSLFVNPCAEDSGRWFAYTVDGGIGCMLGLSPTDQARGHYMIRVLHLDCPRLTNMRRSHAAGLQAALQGLINVGAIDDIDDLALSYLTPDNGGKLQRFFSLSRQMFGDRAEVVLRLLEE